MAGSSTSAASTRGTTPYPGGSVYALTKGAIDSFTRGLSRELGPKGITVNNVEPGPVDTDGNPAEGPNAEALRKLISVGRFGSVEDITSLVGYLASPESRHITGVTIVADGGFSA